MKLKRFVARAILCSVIALVVLFPFALISLLVGSIRDGLIVFGCAVLGGLIVVALGVAIQWAWMNCD